jgi:predicted O-linked N-acetylglucosamine transferase (SPINDLY family)
MIVVDERQLTLDDALQLARQHHQSGRLDQAERLYAAILPQAPEQADAWHLAGVCSLQRGDHGAAVARIQRAIELDPNNPGYRNNLGLALKALHRFDQAIASFQYALHLNPDYATAHVSLGNMLKDQGELEQAAAHFRIALTHKPELAEAHNNLANVLKGLAQYQEAIAHYQTALRLRPELSEAHNNLGNALKEQGRLNEAVASYQQALRIKPAYPEACLHLGHTLKALGRSADALASYRQAWRLKRDDAEIRCALIDQMQALCEWDGLDTLMAAQRGDVGDSAAPPIAPFAFLRTPSSAEEQYRCAQKFARACFQPFARLRDKLAFTHQRVAKPKLRIGYLSADFHDHATAYLIAELFELHEREHFEIFAYSYGSDDRGPMRTRLAAACDRFVDLRERSLADSASIIHADRIDILVDLKGYTRHARAEILALRPAPIQVHYLGYPGTMGTDFIDYLITDHVVTPPGQAKYFSEKLVYLPDCYQVNDRRRVIADAVPSRQHCGLPEQGMVFCCLNSPSKITSEIFDIWMRLLLAVPGSVLWLLQGDPLQMENLIRETGRRGVAPARLVFAPKLPHAEHLARYRCADLFLDTFPFNAHTTASDALWAGLPLLTCSGETFVSRVAGSLLHSIDLPQLAVSDLRDYETLALRLAQHASELLALRQHLERNRLTCALFDSRRFTANLERAYQTMWQRYLDAEPPQELDIVQ